MTAVANPPRRTPPESPRRPTARRVVLGAVLVLIGVGWLVDSLGLAAVRWSMVLPAVLVVIGVALLSTARRGVPGGLVAVGIVLSALLVVSSAVSIPFSGRLAGVGDVTHRPASLGELEDGYALAMGTLTVDLRDLPVTGRSLTLETGVGMGELVVILPPGAAADVDARAGVGEVMVLDRSQTGVGVDVRERVDGSGADTALVLKASTGLGRAEVRR